MLHCAVCAVLCHAVMCPAVLWRYIQDVFVDAAMCCVGHLLHSAELG